jgi:hypothetical protein
MIPLEEKYCDECKDKAIKAREEYYTEHKEQIDERKRKQWREYKASRTDKKEQAFYNSKSWLMTRDYIKGKYNGLCLMCLLEYSKVNVMDIIHHITEVKGTGGWNKRLLVDNLVPLCQHHHWYVHIEYNKNEYSKQNMQERLLKLLQIYEDKYYV